MVCVQKLELDRIVPSVTSNRMYQEYLLNALLQLGGKVSSKDVYDLVFFEMELKDGDTELIKSNGALFYKNRLQWARDALVKGGLLKPFTPGINFGMWELTEEIYKLYGKYICQAQK